MPIPTPLQDRLAEYIAEHDTSIKAAARALGADYSRAKKAWKRILHNLGWQKLTPAQARSLIKELGLEAA